MNQRILYGFSQHRIGMGPRDPFLFEQEPTAMGRGMVGQVRVEHLLAWGQVRKFCALRGGAIGSKALVFLQGGDVREDRADSEPETAQVADQLEAWGVYVTPVDHCPNVPRPGDASVVDDAEAVAV